MRNIIYLDDAATTKVQKKVVDEMNKFYLEDYGNPSSMHQIGENARRFMDFARKRMALELNCKPEEIIFSSGSTESNNLAFFGLSRNALGNKRRKIIISSIEHSSIFAISDILKKEGYKIIEIPVDKCGLIDIGKLENEIDDNTLLVSIMHVNNEIGVIQDIERIGKICREKRALFHTDCAQSFGKLKIDVKKMNIDLVSCGAHKIGGPKGIGLLYVRHEIQIEPIIYGGGQERGLRGGTENVPGIIGFSKALELIKRENKERVRKIRDYFISGLEELGGVINGSKEKRIYNNVNVSFIGKDGERIVLGLSGKGIMCSTGSACESRNKKETRVLKAIGLNRGEIDGSIRFTIDGETTMEDIDFVLKVLGGLVKNGN